MWGRIFPMRSGHKERVESVRGQVLGKASVLRSITVIKLCQRPAGGQAGEGAGGADVLRWYKDQSRTIQVRGGTPRTAQSERLIQMLMRG